MCLGAGSRQYCRYTKSPWVTTLCTTGQRKFDPVGFEPTTSGLDLPMVYQLSYEANTGTGRDNLGSRGIELSAGTVFLRARAAIKFTLQAARIFEKKTSEQRTLRATA